MAQSDFKSLQVNTLIEFDSEWKWKVWWDWKCWYWPKIIQSSGKH